MGSRERRILSLCLGAVREVQLKSNFSCWHFVPTLIAELLLFSSVIICIFKHGCVVVPGKRL